MFRLRDLFRRRRVAQREAEPPLEFLTIQEGGPERDLKALLADDFADVPGITRAYLAGVISPHSSDPHVVLCLVVSEPMTYGVARLIAERFFSQFGRRVAVDTFLLSTETESEVRRVCVPFYQTAV